MKNSAMIRMGELEKRDSLGQNLLDEMQWVPERKGKP